MAGLVVGNDHAARRLIEQRTDLGLDLQAHQPGGGKSVQAGINAAVIRVEGPTQADQYTDNTDQNKMQSQQEHACKKKHHTTHIGKRGAVYGCALARANAQCGRSGLIV
ncbi:hypothetical protein D3C84_942370 [compost metagenome]